MRVAFASFLLVAPVMAGCAQTGGDATSEVMASFYPLQFLAQRIAGDHLRVGVIVPRGAEPHDHDLKPTDASALGRAKLIVLQGAGLEPFAGNVAENAARQGVPLVVASEGLPLLAAGAGEDPHTWISPRLAGRMAQSIEDALRSADPANATDYARDGAQLRGELSQLDERYRSGLAHCAKPKIITTHAAFAYLSEEYNFTQFAISGVEPDAEPSAGKVREVADIARRENITTIFFETLVSPRVAQVIADEVHGRTAVLDPLEGLTDDEAARGVDYLALMQANLDALRAAMECA